MAIRTATQRESTAVSYGANAVQASLHTADPDTTGASEVSGGSYARVNLTWTPGTPDGVVNTSATFTQPGGITATHVGLWGSGGAFLDAAALDQPSTTTVQQQVAVSLSYTQA